MGAPQALRAATRGSALARTQTDLVAAALGRPVQAVVVQTAGDRHRDVPIHEIGGRGVFVKEVQAAVLDGRADFAVHSAKDLPSSAVDGLVIAAVPRREDPRDALVGCALAALPTGARVATGSVRRRAQLAWLRPDLAFAELRGNIDTRLAKAASFDAVVVALAALRRLGVERDDVHVLEPYDVVPQVAQGALAIECRADDDVTRALLQAVDHAPSHRAVLAERAMLHDLGGGCDLPVGALATVAGDAIEITGVLATLDGRIVLRASRSGTDPEALGREVAGALVAGGGDLLLDDLRPAATDPQVVPVP